MKNRCGSSTIALLKQCATVPPRRRVQLILVRIKIVRRTLSGPHISSEAKGMSSGDAETYFVMSSHNIQIDEFGSFVARWFEVVLSIDMGRVAIIICVPWQVCRRS
jgi:hypothetical protein